MPVEDHIYNDRFFRNTIKLEAESAANFVEVVLSHFRPASIIDIGCGAGIYLHAFWNKGILDLQGVDGSAAARESFMLDQSLLDIADLAEPYPLIRSYDLCLCLEVAEHLREEDADTLVSTLINAADDIIFTAAVPGQGPRSIGHINEQPHEYWINKFAAAGFSFEQDLSERMRKEMEEGGVVWWIVNNLMVFKTIDKKQRG